MGHIIFKYFDSNVDNSDFSLDAERPNVESLYGIEVMKKLQFNESGDFTIKIDVSNKGNIKWEDFNYPNDEIKGKILEISYYNNKASDLQKILNDIENCREFKDRFKLHGYGEAAKNLINSLEEHRYFTKSLFHKQELVNRIDYDLNEIIDLDYFKKSSEREKIVKFFEVERLLIKDIKTSIFKMKFFN